ncbi:tripartite tricarboxylate transporter substrate binding protein [Bordetella sp. BOR01]|uniref:Bug family tripartite tricarboxylate transporter substrate binding protein n=1 Tax=Bordetella sp. BOR01 TaxID=2854779 RepID=UPI001C4728AC|nr:tripartite tricarboxylate transporter substrate binding protein [Bordetella sp. BOR01]MBV7481809.1 tripartite tricarboxylate transporter substrate binding protein [Bordetella sp. BOR01]
MKMPVQIYRAVRLLLAAACLAGAPALADETGPVRLIAPYPAGGPADVVARLVAEPISRELGRPVVIDNKAGASGTIGAGTVARADPDGATLLFNTSIQVVLPHLMPLPYDTLKDFTPLAQVNSIPFVLVINKDLPFRSVGDLVAYAKANPGKLNYATNSPGSASHLAAEQFRKQAGVDLMHVPYKGSAPALTDLIAGRVQLMFEQGPSVLPFLKSGQLRAIAVTSAERATIVPDVPTFVEAGYPGFVYNNWQGIWAPGGMPAATAEKLSAAIGRALRQPAVRQRLLDLGTQPADMAGRPFRDFTVQQYDYVGDIVRTAGIKLD